MLDEDTETIYRAKIILLKDDGYTVPEIRAINHHDDNIRKWIQYRFNEKGMDGIVSKIHKHKPIKKITDDIEKMVVEIASKIQEKIMVDYHFYVFLKSIIAGFIFTKR